MAAVNAGATATGVSGFSILITLVILLLLFGLFVTFLGMWRRSKGTFPAALTLFAGAFLLKTFADLLILLGRASKKVIIPARFEQFTDVFEAIALAVLLWIALA